MDWDGRFGHIFMKQITKKKKKKKEDYSITLQLKTECAAQKIQKHREKEMNIEHNTMPFFLRPACMSEHNKHNQISIFHGWISKSSASEQMEIFLFFLALSPSLFGSTATNWHTSNGW